MRILRLAELLVLKHAAMSPADHLEISLRADIHQLWRLPNELFNILSACAQAEPAHPKTKEDAKAIEGFKFCKQLISMIDHLKSKMDTIPLGEIREVLLNTVNLIQKHISLKFDEKGKVSEKGEKSHVQFPHVSELIFQMVHAGTVHGRKQRDEQFGKAKTGLSRILSLSTTMLEKIEKLEMIVPEKFTYKQVTNVDIDQPLPERFVAQPAPLSVYDIVDFIRQHGPEYGITTTEDWGTVFRDDPQFQQQMARVIHAINSGKVPKDSTAVKDLIGRILTDHEERKSTNVREFEDT